MSENDAEWFDFDKKETTTRRPGPNNPPPRPRTRPPGESPRRGLFPPNERRPRRPFPRGGGRDAADREPPSAEVSQATIISTSVVGVVIFILIVLLLLYMFVLRKKLRQVKKKQMDSQYSLRVEDITHLDIDDSSKLYVNTTDLQKLVSSVRVKNKKLPPPIPSTLDYPDVVQVGRPPVPLPGTDGVDKVSRHNSLAYFENKVVSSPAPSTIQEEVIYSNIMELEHSPPLISRPAPPPPTKKWNTDKQHDQLTSQESYSTASLSKPKSFNEPNLTTKHIEYVSGQTQNASSTSGNLDECHMPPLSNSSNSSIAENSFVKSTVKPALPLTKPRSLKNVTNQSQTEPNPNRRPPSPPKTVKPSKSGSQGKPHLPLLKMNLRPAAFTRLESNVSTPDTAISYIADTATPTGPDNEFDPATLSVKKKMALLQGMMNNDGPTTVPR